MINKILVTILKFESMLARFMKLEKKMVTMAREIDKILLINLDPRIKHIWTRSLEVGKWIEQHVCLFRFHFRF